MPDLDKSHFVGGGDLSRDLIKKLSMPSLSDEIEDTLTGLGWQGQVIGADGSRVDAGQFVMREKLSDATISIEASKVWENAPKDVILNISPMDGSMFNFEKGLYSDYAFWACMSVCFFGSFRMGELVAPNRHHFDPSSSLCWNDVVKSHGHFRILIKKPKSKNPKGETIHIFKFADKKLCPYKALHKLESLQEKKKTFDPSLPIFRFESGCNITKKSLNKFLAQTFKNSKKKVSSRSFRSGIPTALGKFPDIAADQHIKGWGRWNSKSFLRYEHFGIHQKKWIFKKIERALLK